MAAVVFILVGVGMAGFGVWLWFRSRRFLARAVRTSGVIVGLRRGRASGSDGRGTVYTPIFRFTAPDGRDIVRPAMSRNSHPTLRPGDRVAVLFDPERPSDARIDSIGNRGPAAALFVAVFGIVFAGIGIGILTGAIHAEPIHTGGGIHIHH